MPTSLRMVRPARIGTLPSTKGIRSLHRSWAEQRPSLWRTACAKRSEARSHQGTDAEGGNAPDQTREHWQRGQAATAAGLPAYQRVTHEVPPHRCRGQSAPGGWPWSQTLVPWWQARARWVTAIADGGSGRDGRAGSPQGRAGQNSGGTEDVHEDLPATTTEAFRCVYARARLAR